MSSPTEAHTALSDLEKRLDSLEPHDFFAIEQASTQFSAFDDQQSELKLEECRQKIRDCFHGAVFLWKRGVGGAPRGPAWHYPHPARAPDFTLMSWNILCHRIHMNYLSSLTPAQKRGLEQTYSKDKKLKNAKKDEMELKNIQAKLMSFHAEGRRDAWAVRCSRIVETLYLSGADIFCLQEVQAGVGQQSTPYDLNDVFQEYTKKTSKDQSSDLSADAAFTLCTDWLYRYKKQRVIADILKDMNGVNVYNEVRAGSQPINMKFRDIFLLAACDDPERFPGTVTLETLRDFGLRGQEPHQFFEKLQSLQGQGGWQQLNKFGKVSKLIDIINDLGLGSAFRPWLNRSSVSQLVDFFHICDDDLCSEDGRQWCCKVLSLTEAETTLFQSKAEAKQASILVSIDEAAGWREKLISKMKEQRLGHPGFWTSRERRGSIAQKWWDNYTKAAAEHNFKAVLLSKTVSRGHNPSAPNADHLEHSRSSGQFVLLFFVLSGRVTTGQRLLGVLSSPGVTATRPFNVTSIMDWGRVVESVGINHTREFDVSYVSSLHMMQQRCCFSMAIDSRAAFEALADGDFLYSPECFAAENELREMSGNHLEQIMDTPIYDQRCKAGPVFLKDMYQSVFLPNVKKENARAVVVAVAGELGELASIQQLLESALQDAEFTFLDIVVEKPDVRDGSGGAGIETWFKLKVKRSVPNDDDLRKDWPSRVLCNQQYMAQFKQSLSKAKPGQDLSVFSFYEPEEGNSYGVAVLFRKDKFRSCELPEELKRWSFMPRLEPLLFGDKNFGDMNLNQASCAAITILEPISPSGAHSHVCVVSTHLASKFESPTFQLAQFSALIHDLETHLSQKYPNIRVVVCGDFNSNRGSIVSRYATDGGFPESMPKPLMSGDDDLKTPVGDPEVQPFLQQMGHLGLFCGIPGNSDPVDLEFPIFTTYPGGHQNRDNFPWHKVWQSDQELRGSTGASTDNMKLPPRLRWQWCDADLFSITSPASLDSIDHAFHTANLHLVKPNYVADEETQSKQCSRIRALVAEDNRRQIVPSEHPSDEALPWFCREGLPSDHLPLELAFNFCVEDGTKDD